MTPVNDFIGSPKTLHPSPCPGPARPGDRKISLLPFLPPLSLAFIKHLLHAKCRSRFFHASARHFTLSSQTSPEIKHFLPAERCSSFVFQVCFMASPFTRSLGVVSSSALHPGKCQFWICRRYPPCPYVLLVPPLPGHRSNTSWLVPLHASKTLRDSCRLHCIA